MSDKWKRLVFTVMFSLFATATAAALMYLLPVMIYIGYQTQIPSILEGFALGALLFSIAGTFVGMYTSRPAIHGLIISIILAVILTLVYRSTGVASDSDLTIGSFASQSFSLLFAAMFQNFLPGQKRIKSAGISVAIFTGLNVFFFLVIAVLYLILGQAYLPNTIFYLEILCAAIGIIALFLFFKSGKKAESS
jgi:hypothetical protein